MVIQQIHMQNTSTPAAKPESRVQNGDDFRSMLRSAVQKPDSEEAQKPESSKAKGKTDKADKSDRKQTGAGRAKKDAPQQVAALPPKEAALLVPGTAKGNLQAAASAGGESSKGLSAAQGVSALSGTQQSAALPGTALSGQTLPTGAEQTKGSLSATSVGKQAQPELKSASAAVPAVQTDSTAQQGTLAQKSALSRQTAAGPSGASQIQTAKAQGNSSGQSTGLAEGQKSAGEEQTGAAAGTGTKQSVSEEAASPSGKSDGVQSGAVASQSAASQKDGKTARTDGLSGLYAGGNVVIRVSGGTAQKTVSPVRQVVNMAANQLQKGKSEFKMDLYPQSLGKVSVKLTSQNGLLTVEIAASNPKTQSLLLSGSAEIRNILQASTGQNVQTVIPDQQAAQWYGQPQDSGGNTGGQQQKRKEPHKSKWDGIGSVSAELNTGDFLSMIQQIGALAG